MGFVRADANVGVSGVKLLPRYWLLGTLNGSVVVAVVSWSLTLWHAVLGYTLGVLSVRMGRVKLFVRRVKGVFGCWLRLRGETLWIYLLDDR